MPLMRIELNDTGVLVQTQTDDGSVVVKAVKAEDLARAMYGDLKVDTGWMGPNIRRVSEGSGKTVVLVEDPPQVRRVQYFDRPYQIPVPRCLFRFTIANGAVVDSRVVATTDPIPGAAWLPRNDTPVYRFPFPNVYDDTHVCWGRRTVLPAVKPVEVAGLVNMFYGIPFNGDLASVGLPMSWRGESVQGIEWVFQKIRGLPTFPDDLLLPKTTLRQWWEERL